MFKNRRKNLVNILKQQYPEISKGVILLFADFENTKYKFRQESSFYYLTGITEPACVLAIYFDQEGIEEILYLPNYGGVREKWVTTFLGPDGESAKMLGVNQIKSLGEVQKSFIFGKKFSKEKYLNLIGDLNRKINIKTTLFALIDESEDQYFDQTRICKKLNDFFPEIKTINIILFVDEMRRIKSKHEVDLIYNAIQITSLAHESAAKIIKQNRTEIEIQAMIEAVFTKMDATRAFPSIVATGKNTTVLHYFPQNKKLQKGDLVLIDIGSEYKYYASDLTRTYPVGGKFSQRQKEVYEIVLQAQSYVENMAKPGMFINNQDQPEKSLQHQAVEFLEQKGFEKYFFHGIGHYLGIDVHDVGNVKEPLMPGAVFTIEPGIYITEENLGIRIEDDYLMTDQGAVCLSYQLPKTIEEIEALFK
ncbi:MAG: Xaa-Pro peptidase family protein [bacterium]